MNHIAPGRMMLLQPANKMANWYLGGRYYFESIGTFDRITHMNIVPATQ